MRKYVPFALLKSGQQFHTVHVDGTPGARCMKISSANGHHIMVPPPGSFTGPEVNAVMLTSGLLVQVRENEAVIQCDDSHSPNTLEKFKEIVDKMPDVESVYADLKIKVTPENVNQYGYEDGDMAVWYTPDAIKSHFDGEEGMYAEWVKTATFKQLLEVGLSILDNDTTWSDFHDHIIMALDVAMKEKA